MEVGVVVPDGIVDKLLSVAEFIESKALSDGEVVAAGVCGGASVNLFPEAFIRIASGFVVDISQSENDMFCCATVDGVLVVCVARSVFDKSRMASVFTEHETIGDELIAFNV